MATNPKVVDPHLDWTEQVKSIRLEVDQDRARALGLTPLDVQQMMQTWLKGFTITQYREGIERIDVVARAVPEERLALGQLPTLTVTTRNGIAVPLSQIARLNYEFEEPILWRRNRDIVLTVRGDIVDNVQAPDVTGEILPSSSRSRPRSLTATASRPADRSKKASRRTAPSSWCSRSWRSPCWRC
jgi:multidrug efflux pump subunit AcrB